MAAGAFGRARNYGWDGPFNSSQQGWKLVSCVHNALSPRMPLSFRFNELYIYWFTVILKFQTISVWVSNDFNYSSVIAKTQRILYNMQSLSSTRNWSVQPYVRQTSRLISPILTTFQATRSAGCEVRLLHLRDSVCCTTGFPSTVREGISQQSRHECLNLIPLSSYSSPDSKLLPLWPIWTE